jgi:acyl-coenzyme A thioesterase 13
LQIPPHFEPLSTSPFSERIGPLYLSTRDALPVIGVRIEEHHANRRGRAHGGLLMTVADIALSRAVSEHLPPGATMATADLHIAFLDGIGQGEWLEAVPTIDRVGRALIHASCLLRIGQRNVARALATFAVRLG